VVKQSDRYIRKSMSTPTFKVIRKPDSWRTGWQNNPTISAGPRWTTGNFTFIKPPKDEKGDDTFGEPGKPRKPPSYPRFRETFHAQKAREYMWVPGPGTYKSEREFMTSKEKDSPDEVDTNLTTQEAAPDFSFGREVKQTTFRIRNHEFQDMAKTSYKFMRNHGSYPKADETFTPGPGTYNQFTSFGGASGGSRKHYLGGVAAHGWEKKHRGEKDDGGEPIR